MLIFPKKARFLSPQINLTDYLLGIVIKHPLIAQTMKAWFDLAWEGAEKYSKPANTKVPLKEYM